MESLDSNINPCLFLIQKMRSQLAQGHSVRAAVQGIIGETKDPFILLVKQVLLMEARGEDIDPYLNSKLKSHYRRTLVKIICRGLKGEPIYDHLSALEVEVQSACEIEIQEHLAKLPFLLLIPLLLFQFPAFLILLFGPLLANLMRGL